MYLLNTATVELHRFDKLKVPPYAILSHVWGTIEQTFRDTPLVKGARDKRGVFQRVSDHALRRPSKKIKGACAKALHDGYRWLWADTTCIDAGNSAELSEAINSMFDIYAKSSMCYAYLEDVPPGEDPHPPESSFRRSKWFRRIWTLQELIAPASVVFLSSDWQPIGAKWRLAPLIESVTNIDQLVLTHKRPLEEVSIACRMSWAARREARREEDRAYALMGIFGVCMPTIYGERGRAAFIRLQEEIVKRSEDQSVFAWGPALHDHGSGTFVANAKEHDYEPQTDTETLFASSPSDFAGCADLSPIPLQEFAARLGFDRENVPVYTPTAAGVRTTLPVVPLGQTSKTPNAMLGFLACVDGNGRLVALYLRAHSNKGSKLLVGGYVSQGSRVNSYCRTTRLSSSEQYLICSSNLQEVIIHSSRPSFARERSGSPGSSSSPSRHSLIFFEPPCTIRISHAARKSLERMGYITPVLPERGFRLTSAGEARSISFIGYQPFTVHFGVCAIDAQAVGSTQSAQLWATVTFDSGSDVDSLLVKPDCGDLASVLLEAPPGYAEGKDVCPDESMLVQQWKDHRRAFGNKSGEVRLAFNYPCQMSDCASERGMAEVYELDIIFRGYYHVDSDQRRRYKGSAVSYSIGSVAASRVKNH
ncbi:hypothetical protein VTO73DRAFT_7177 [Trametes versicolor]